MEYWLHIIDLIGVAVFAISGTLMAYKKQMDGFGVIVLASFTAIGGGTIRDIVLNVPVFWLTKPVFFYVIIAAAIGTIVYLKFIKAFPLKLWLIADAIGLAFFNVMGLQKALEVGASPFIAIILGTVTGVFGGMLRDIICREIPVVLRGDLYASTCILGGSLYILLDNIGQTENICMIAALTTTLASRLVAIKWDLGLPVFGKEA